MSAEEINSMAADSGLSQFREDAICLHPDRTYKYLLGDTSSGALYSTLTDENYYSDLATVSLEDFQWCLERGLLNHTALHSFWCEPHPSNGILQDTLQALAFAAIIYDGLPDATVDVGIFDRSLLETHWARMIRGRHVETEAHVDVQPGSENGALVFSLLSYLESGIYDVDPKQLDKVIALSSANSLFVPLSVR